jgi:amidase
MASALEQWGQGQTLWERPRPDMGALATPRPDLKSIVTHPPLLSGGAAMDTRTAV